MQAIFLDIEATGLDPFRHSPIDIALKVIDLNEALEKGAYQSIIKISKEHWDKRDLASMEVNGYLWEEILKGNEIEKVREEIITLFIQLNIHRGKSVFICQNPAFDRAFFSHIIEIYIQEKLNWPYHWLDFASMYWALLTQKVTQFPETINLSKNEIARQYQILPEAFPHKAINGVDHLIECYKIVVGFKPNLYS